MRPGCGAILSDPCASFWIKNALRSALGRDPVDALNDAEGLADILQEDLVILQHPTDGTSIFKKPTEA
jgi:hypothetical protein